MLMISPRLPSLALAALLAVALTGGCASDWGNGLDSNGPTVGVRNETDVALKVRFWIGDRVAGKATPPSTLRAERIVDLRPSGSMQYNLGALANYKGAGNSFVQVQIVPVQASFQQTREYWFELNPPPPFTVRITGKLPDLKFARQTGSTMVTVPPALWVPGSTLGLRPVAATPPVAQASPATGQPRAATRSP